MALSDYRLCDVCEDKAFYDAELNYEQGKDWQGNPIPESELARVAGKPEKWGYKLGYLGDWAVICTDCAKTHKTIVVPINHEA